MSAVPRLTGENPTLKNEDIPAAVAPGGVTTWLPHPCSESCFTC